MKKLLSILFSLTLFAFSLFAQKEPLFVIRAKSPQALAQKLMKVQDPQIQLMTIMSLAPLGYPNFEGVDSSSNVLLGAWSKNGNSNFIAIKASKDSPLTAKIIENSKVASNLEIIEKDSWLIITDSAKKSETLAWLEANLNASIDSDIVLSINIDGFNEDSLNLSDSKQQRFIDFTKKNLDTLEITLNLQNSNLEVGANFNLKNGSLNDLISSFKRVDCIEGAKYFPADSSFYALSSCVIGENTESSLKSFLKEILSEGNFANLEKSIDEVFKYAKVGEGASASVVLDDMSVLKISNSSVKISDYQQIIDSLVNSFSTLLKKENLNLDSKKLYHLEKIDDIEVFSAENSYLTSINGFAIEANKKEKLLDCVERIKSNKIYENHLPTNIGDKAGIVVIKKEFISKIAGDSFLAQGQEVPTFEDIVMSSSLKQNQIRFDATICLKNISKVLTPLLQAILAQEALTESATN